MKLIRNVSLMLAMGLFISQAAIAQPGSNSPDERPCMQKRICTINADGNAKPGQGCFANIPDLSEEQQKKIKKLRTVHIKKMLPLRNELREKEARLQTLRTAEKPDMNAINTQIESIGAVKIQIAKEREAHRQEIRKILTEEQRLQFDMHHNCCSSRMKMQRRMQRR